jgi:hypothetical protein
LEPRAVWHSNFMPNHFTLKCTSLTRAASNLRHRPAWPALNVLLVLSRMSANFMAAWGSMASRLNA